MAEAVNGHYIFNECADMTILRNVNKLHFDECDFTRNMDKANILETDMRSFSLRKVTHIQRLRGVLAYGILIRLG